MRLMMPDVVSRQMRHAFGRELRLVAQELHGVLWFDNERSLVPGRSVFRRSTSSPRRRRSVQPPASAGIAPFVAVDASWPVNLAASRAALSWCVAAVAGSSAGRVCGLVSGAVADRFAIRLR